MGYAVLHLEKASGTDAGMSAHIERTIAPKNADETRTHLNRELIEFSDEVCNRTQAIQRRLDTAGLHRKIGKNQVRVVRVLLTGSPDDMKNIERNGLLNEWCNNNLRWLKQIYGEENIVSAVLHLDETTPHIHATMIPIVTGERRKARKEQEELTSRKKYRKKNTGSARLCADDVMSRVKLKEYQNSYAEAMAIHGLKRGIDGSDAKHISTSQYYRELLSQTDGVQEDLENLLRKKMQAERDLSKTKSEIKTEKLKSTVIDVTTSAIEGVGSLFGSSKIKQQQREIEALQTKNCVLDGEIKKLNKHIEIIESEHDTIANKLKLEIKKIYDLFPDIRELLRIESLCRAVGFGIEMTKDILAKNPVGFKGELYSSEFQRKFYTDRSVAKIELDPKEPMKLHLSIDGHDIIEWFRQRYREFHKSQGRDIKISQYPEQKRGRKM